MCNNITDVDPCLYCTSSTRNRKTICVVEEPHNIMAIEKTRQYGGLYHVLGGALAPLRGIGPDQLHLKSLIERLKGGTVEEIIIATNPNAEGEATAMYLSKLLKPLGVRVTRIGVGHSRGRRPGIRRRSHHDESHGRPPRSLMAWISICGYLSSVPRSQNFEADYVDPCAAREPSRAADR